MVTIGKQIELGKGLLKEFYRLDSEVNGQQLEQDRFTRNALIDEVNFFVREAEKYIDKMQDFINSKEILLKSRQHEDVNDCEVGNLALRNFYSYGVAIKEIEKALQTSAQGSPKNNREQDGNFHYIAEERIIYRGYIEFPVHSQQFKSESICEVVFEKAPEWVLAIDIGDKQEEKYGIMDDVGDPYKWIRPACNRINKAIREHFGIEFDLFEKKAGQVRLSPRAIKNSNSQE